MKLWQQLQLHVRHRSGRSTVCGIDVREPGCKVTGSAEWSDCKACGGTPIVRPESEPLGSPEQVLAQLTTRFGLSMGDAFSLLDGHRPKVLEALRKHPPAEVAAALSRG